MDRRRNHLWSAVRRLRHRVKQKPVFVLQSNLCKSTLRTAVDALRHLYVLASLLAARLLLFAIARHTSCLCLSSGYARFLVQARGMGSWLRRVSDCFEHEPIFVVQG